MKRFGSRLDVAKLQIDLPLQPFFFDCIYVDGDTLIDHPAAERFSALSHAVPEQYRVVMSEIPLGRGRLWICDLDFAASADVDPAARIVADNIYRAAADPDSTKNLQPVPPHEVLLKGMTAAK